MRIMIGLALAAFLGWCAWWWIGSTAYQRGIAAWLAEREAAGWQAGYDDISVVGFPNRIDTTITGLELADPVAGWAWSAPFFQILTLSYKPNHVIAVWPDEQRLSTLRDTTTVTAERMRGSLVFAPDTSLALDRMRLEIVEATLAGTTGTTALGSANLATERVTDATAPDFAHAIGLDIVDLSVPQTLLDVIDRNGVLPPRMEKTHIDVVAAFDAPWDRLAIEGRKPQLTALRLRDVNASWGRLNLAAQGRLNVDRDGFPDGEVTIKARNWRQMLVVAEDAGLIARDLARSLERGLGLLAGLSGGDQITVPLTFSSGAAWLGPVPLGPAPRLVIR